MAIPPSLQENNETKGTSYSFIHLPALNTANHVHSHYVRQELYSKTVRPILHAGPELAALILLYVLHSRHPLG